MIGFDQLIRDLTGISNRAANLSPAMERAADELALAVISNIVSVPRVLSGDLANDPDPFFGNDFAGTGLDLPYARRWALGYDPGGKTGRGQYANKGDRFHELTDRQANYIAEDVIFDYVLS